jgi:hypothetical protein
MHCTHSLQRLPEDNLTWDRVSKGTGWHGTITQNKTDSLQMQQRNMEFQLLLYLQAINFLFFWTELEPGCRQYRCALFSLEDQSQIPGVTILQIRKCIFWDYKSVERTNCVLYKCHKHNSCIDNCFISLLSEHIFIYRLKTQPTAKTQTLSVLHKQDEGHG